MGFDGFYGDFFCVFHGFEWFLFNIMDFSGIVEGFFFGFSWI